MPKAQGGGANARLTPLGCAPLGSGEVDARERLEAQWEWGEPLQRHKTRFISVCGCDERVVVEASARDPVERNLQSHIALVALNLHSRRTCTMCAFLFPFSEQQHTRIAHCNFLGNWSYFGVEALHFEPFARVAALRHQLTVVIRSVNLAGPNAGQAEPGPGRFFKLRA